MTRYEHKDAVLILGSNKALVYVAGKLIFKGSGYPGMLTFIKHCNDPEVTNQFRAQLNMREKPRFKKNENKKEDFIEQQNQKIEKSKKTNRLKSQWDRLTR